MVCLLLAPPIVAGIVLNFSEQQALSSSHMTIAEPSPYK
jgi:hypothetical protein